MLNISVVPLDGSPALTTPISFSPNAALGTPYITDSGGNNNYAAVWLDSAIAGISNNAAIGTLIVTIPANATSLSAYAIHFDHASASPNGLASFPKTDVDRPDHALQPQQFLLQRRHPGYLAVALVRHHLQPALGFQRLPVRRWRQQLGEIRGRG